MKTYTIRVRGRKEPLHVEGDSLLEDWRLYQEGKGKDFILTLGNWTGKLSMIADFFVEEAAKSNKSFDDYYEMERKEQLRKLQLVPAERAKELGFFRFLYWGFTKKDSKEIKTNSGASIEDFAIELQKKFFEENPKRVWPDPIIFKAIIKSNTCDQAVTGIVERLIRVDYENEKFAPTYNPTTH